MKEENKIILKNIAHIYTSLANFHDQGQIDRRLEQLYLLEEDDVIDRVLVVIHDFVNDGLINKDEAYKNLEMVTKLNPNRYKSIEDLISRIKLLKSMNMMYTNMPLSENHRLILEAFDEFNKLIDDSFDYFYTGGIMGYLAVGKELVRYHGDLDILINEKDLERLKTLIEKTDKFEFVSRVKKKNNIGHEYFCVYKNVPIDIGLFLFERKNDGSIVRKSYYYKDSNLMIDEEYLTKEYVRNAYTGDIYTYNGSDYKMMSLESIYAAKKDARDKDRYDARIIQDSVDMEIVDKIDREAKKTTFKTIVAPKDNVIKKIENINNIKR